MRCVNIESNCKTSDKTYFAAFHPNTTNWECFPNQIDECSQERCACDLDAAIALKNFLSDSPEWLPTKIQQIQKSRASVDFYNDEFDDLGPQCLKSKVTDLIPKNRCCKVNNLWVQYANQTETCDVENGKLLDGSVILNNMNTTIGGSKKNGGLFDDLKAEFGFFNEKNTVEIKVSTTPVPSPVTTTTTKPPEVQEEIPVIENHGMEEVQLNQTINKVFAESVNNGFNNFQPTIQEPEVQLKATPTDKKPTNFDSQLLAHLDKLDFSIPEELYENQGPKEVAKSPRPIVGSTKPKSTEALANQVNFVPVKKPQPPAKKPPRKNRPKRPKKRPPKRQVSNQDANSFADKFANLNFGELSSEEALAIETQIRSPRGPV